MREHLAAISPVHAIVPAVTAGKLTHACGQQILCGIYVSVMFRAALRARPDSDIEPQLIELVSALRAGLAAREFDSRVG